uniref:Uncharacterized protein n=1 Tax=Anguilla anguilla TaxID=7936 RepID=A0A0E9Y025_ANGAN
MERESDMGARQTTFWKVPWRLSVRKQENGQQSLFVELLVLLALREDESFITTEKYGLRT